MTKDGESVKDIENPPSESSSLQTWKACVYSTEALFIATVNSNAAKHDHVKLADFGKRRGEGPMGKKDMEAHQVFILHSWKERQFKE